MGNTTVRPDRAATTIVHWDTCFTPLRLYYGLTATTGTGYSTSRGTVIANFEKRMGILNK